MFKGRPLIIQFYHLFWKENYTKWKDSQDDEVAKRKFYTQNKDQFISEYASSHIAEDIAESFTEFVLKHSNKVRGTRYEAQKDGIFLSTIQSL
ncbi:hypothetical protein ACFSKI_01735 [Pseudogracilibacillus auburnensis]|uniref:Uncharacterized protein n=1 Tax=Pseudogracilibacillus auburnensis TaxID=1494959 RepID=A0A2V3VF91_9BACI|nr:hypothetical protein [Pseudogracilibacillus auburnensis]PXW80407.1 hypothetical protein DFR56_12823 [Pseudogracilibacillus auburnensis]